MIYAQINASEEKLLKKAILEARASAISSQNTALVLAKLKKSKIAATIGTATVMKDVEQELEKIKQALPELAPKIQHPKAKEYGRELEKIREKIVNLNLR